MISRACIVKWVTKSNRPANIVDNLELQNIIAAGWPNAIIPSVSTVGRDINFSFPKCHEKIGKMLQVSIVLGHSRPPLQGMINLLYRNIQDTFISQPILGHHPTIGPLLHGQSISSTKVKCLDSCWTL
jgi:hypothetical protein